MAIASPKNDSDVSKFSTGVTATHYHVSATYDAPTYARADKENDQVVYSPSWAVAPFAQSRGTYIIDHNHR